MTRGSDGEELTITGIEEKPTTEQIGSEIILNKNMLTGGQGVFSAVSLAGDQKLIISRLSLPQVTASPAMTFELKSESSPAATLKIDFEKLKFKSDKASITYQEPGTGAIQLSDCSSNQPICFKKELNSVSITLPESFKSAGFLISGLTSTAPPLADDAFSISTDEILNCPRGYSCKEKNQCDSKLQSTKTGLCTAVGMVCCQDFNNVPVGGKCGPSLGAAGEPVCKNACVTDEVEFKLTASVCADGNKCCAKKVTCVFAPTGSNRIEGLAKKTGTNPYNFVAGMKVGSQDKVACPNDRDICVPFISGLMIDSPYYGSCLPFDGLEARKKFCEYMTPETCSATTGNGKQFYDACDTNGNMITTPCRNQHNVNNK